MLVCSMIPTKLIIWKSYSVNLVSVFYLYMVSTPLLTLYIGIDQNSFVTIVDEEEDDAFINVVLNIQSSYGTFQPPTCNAY